MLAGPWATEAPRGGVVSASMTSRRPATLQLHRATFKVAAVSFWGLATIVMATNYLGSDLQVNYPTEWVVTALACAAGIVCWVLRWAESQLAELWRLELEDGYLSSIEALAAALDGKGRPTEERSREAGALVRAVGQRLGLREDTLRFLEYSALLHDIGKIGIPGYILH